MDKFLADFRYWMWFYTGIYLIVLLLILGVVMVIDMNREMRVVSNYIPQSRP